jgi:hypothetical protein
MMSLSLWSQNIVLTISRLKKKLSKWKLVSTSIKKKEYVYQKKGIIKKKD